MCSEVFDLQCCDGVLIAGEPLLFVFSTESCTSPHVSADHLSLVSDPLHVQQNRLTQPGLEQNTLLQQSPGANTESDVSDHSFNAPDNYTNMQKLHLKYCFKSHSLKKNLNLILLAKI